MSDADQAVPSPLPTGEEISLGTEAGESLDGVRDVYIW